MYVLINICIYVCVFVCEMEKNETSFFFYVVLFKYPNIKPRIQLQIRQLLEKISAIFWGIFGPSFSVIPKNVYLFIPQLHTWSCLAITLLNSIFLKF